MLILAQFVLCPQRDACLSLPLTWTHQLPHSSFLWPPSAKHFRTKAVAQTHLKCTFFQLWNTSMFESPDCFVRTISQHFNSNYLGWIYILNIAGAVNDTCLSWLLNESSHSVLAETVKLITPHIRSCLIFIMSKHSGGPIASFLVQSLLMGCSQDLLAASSGRSKEPLCVPTTRWRHPGRANFLTPLFIAGLWSPVLWPLTVFPETGWTALEEPVITHLITHKYWPGTN